MPFPPQEKRYLRLLPNIDCKEELLKLDSLMEEALAKAPDMLEELAALAVRPGHLSDRWDLTFNG